MEKYFSCSRREGEKSSKICARASQRAEDFFPSLTEGCSEGLGAFRFFFKNILDLRGGAS